MLSIKEWRAMKESTGPAITSAADQSEPSVTDWEFYHTKIQGRAKQLLGWFVDEVSKKPLNLPRKGFILQEIIGPEGLNMSIGEVVRAVSNIKRALAKKATIEKTAIKPVVPQPLQQQQQPIDNNMPTN